MTAAPPRGPWGHRHVSLGGVQLHYVESGTGPPVVLLHGFPEFWYSWRHQLPALAEAGFRAIALDLRGYNESDRPSEVRDYRMRLLMDDVIGLIHHLGVPSATVVGHDWGGVIGWRLAMDHPEVVDRLVVLNAPHPAAFRRELWNPMQWLRSAYIFFFQLPWLPERVLSAGDHAVVRRAFQRQPVRPGTFTSEDVDRYIQAIARPGALMAALHYYRASLRYSNEVLSGVRRITAPTLLIWGERDPYLGIRLSHGLQRWVPDLRVERLGEASHWVQNDAPETVNRLLIDFLQPLKERIVMSKDTPQDFEQARRRLDAPAEVPAADVPPAHYADGNALHRRRDDQAAGGADSSPHETAPSGEKADTTAQPQEA